MKNRQNISRRSALLLGAAAASSLVSTGKSAIAGKKAPTIVELYTSQGCSSCPPADLLLGELSQNPDIITLSLNVDYWDYLGWRDTLGSPRHTKRQQAYAANLGKRQVYTPQMMINGHLDVVGSRRKEVFKTLKQASSPGPRVPMNIIENKQDIVIDVSESPSPALARKATVWVLITSPKVLVPVERGENRGKNITYHNVVRQIVPAGMWEGKSLRITLPKDGLGLQGKRDCVALLQQGTVGKVIGAARMSDPHA